MVQDSEAASRSLPRDGRMVGEPSPGRQGPALCCSIILPCFDASATLDAAVSALLAQRGVDPYELILVDNGSRDDTARRLADWAARRPDRIVLLSESRPGAYAARNAGARAARAQVLLFTDADATVDPGWAQALVRALEDARVLYAGTEVRPAPPRTLVARFAASQGLLAQRQAFAGRRPRFLQTVSLAVRSADLRAVGGFDEDLYSGGDADLCWRLEAGSQDRIPVLLEEAHVAHAHREDWRGLWRQYRRYGEGDRLLRLRHGPRAAPGVLKAILDLLRLAAAPPLALLLLPIAASRGDPLPALRPLLRAWTILARWSGRFGTGHLPRHR
jgi:glycosyltransferase involved in cell wall biosynthesis